MGEEKTEQEKIKRPKPLPKKEFIPDFGEEKKSRKWMVAVITAVCVLALSAGGGYWYITGPKYTGALVQWENVTEEVSPVEMNKIVNQSVSYMKSRCMVPDVESMTETKAKKKLENLLTVKVKYQYSTAVKKGKVIAQSIDAETLVKKGKKIVLTISKGKKVVVTPKPVVQEPVYEPSAPKVPVVTKKPQKKKKQPQDEDVEVEVIAEE